MEKYDDIFKEFLKKLREEDAKLFMNVKNALVQLLETTGVNFLNEVNKRIIELEEEERKKPLDTIDDISNNLVLIIKTGTITFDEIFDKLLILEKSNEFWELIKDIVSENTFPFSKARFLREIELNVFENFINCFFENMVLCRNSYEDFVMDSSVSVNEEDFSDVQFIIESIKRYFLLKNASCVHFGNFCYDTIRLSIERSNIIWGLFDKHKQQLLLHQIYMDINVLDERITELENRFQNQ